MRRAVAGLLARGMIVERSRGCLSTSGGTLARLGEDALPERMARRFLTVSNAMLRLGAAHLVDSEQTAASKREHAASDRASNVERQVSRYLHAVSCSPTRFDMENVRSRSRPHRELPTKPHLEVRHHLADIGCRQGQTVGRTTETASFDYGRKGNHRAQEIQVTHGKNRTV